MQQTMQDSLESTVHAIAACTHHERNQIPTAAVGMSQHTKQDIGCTQELHAFTGYQKVSQ